MNIKYLAPPQQFSYSYSDKLGIKYLVFSIGTNGVHIQIFSVVHIDNFEWKAAQYEKYQVFRIEKDNETVKIS